ncbi:MAG: hypothetical protein LBR17_08425 [Bacteroidales bacterium]|jgi:hypothetical protein|nr:hypothetical protein [Bacteroidales bacterium]
MINITVQDGQSLLDVALQAFGDISRALELAITNGMSLTDDIVSGQVLRADSPNEYNFACATAMTGQLDYDRIFDETFDYTFE